MPPQAFDPVQVSTSISNMDHHPHHHHNMNMNQQQAQQAHMYAAYSAYAPPAYHGHTGFSQPAAAAACNAYPPPPPPPPGWGAAAAGFGGYVTTTASAAFGTVPGAPPQETTAAAITPAYESIQPHENDVLMGRGGKNNQHVGNERLRDMARSVRDRYKASAKKGKSNMSRELVQKVRELDPPGRFLKRNPVTNEWEDVGDEIAREKVSQVLRDAVSEWTGPKAAAKEAKEKEEAKEAPGVVSGIKKEEKPTSTAAESATTTTKAAPATNPKRRPSSRSSSRTNSPVRAASPPISTTVTAAPVPAPMPPVIDVPAIASRVVTETQTLPPPQESNITPPPQKMSPEPPLDEQSTPTTESTPTMDIPPPTEAIIPMRSRADTAESEISVDDLSLPSDLGDNDTVSFETEASLLGDESSITQPTPESSSNASASATENKARKGSFRRMPVQHVPFTSFRRKNRLDRYSNMNMGVSDMSIQSISSQLSSRNLQTQLSGRQLMSTGARQMSSRQLSSRQLSSRQLSSRQLSSRQLSSRQLSSRQLSSRQLSGRHLMSQQQRKDKFSMMGDSELSLDSLSISGPPSRQQSRKDLFMEQYMAMDMGLSDFSLGSLPEGDLAQPAMMPHARPSVIIEGDLEEFSEHSASNSGDPTTIQPTELLDMYATTGVGTSISNMTMNTIGTFSGHSRMSSCRGLLASTGNSMRLESGHSFLASGAADLQLDMLDDELFDDYDYMDDADEFSSDFC